MNVSLSDLAAEQGRTARQMLDAHDVDIAAMQERAAKLKIPLDQYAGELFKPPTKEQQSARVNNV